MIRLARAAASVVAIAALASLMASSARSSSTLTVTNTNDSGGGSLRQAILDANAGGSGNTIDFAIPTSDPGFNGSWFVIEPLSALPSLTQRTTTVDGSTQTGNTNAAGPAVELNGADAGVATGLTLSSSNDVVDDLSIVGFTPAAQTPGGIQINGSAALIEDCWIGTDPGGTDVGNTNNGISFGSDSNQIVGNLITGSTAVGIGNFGGSDNVIQGNSIEHNGLIGIDAGGTSTLIGGSSPGQGNLVSGNTNGGIGVEGTGVTIKGNLVGTNAAGTAAEPNGGNGVSLFNATDTTVGGTSSGSRNVISGNGTDGVGNGIGVNDGSDGTVILGNYIGTDITGSVALGNAGVGIGICCQGVTNTTVGGSAPGAGNVLSGNRVGIDLPGGSSHPSGTTIQGNLIGTDATGTFAIGNTAAGIGTNSAVHLLIGGATAGAGNLISGNDVGINLGVGHDVVVEGNTIGTNLTGSPLANESDGIQIGSQSAGSRIYENTIADNNNDGIDLFSGTHNTFSRNSIFSNGELGIDLGGDGVTLNVPSSTNLGPRFHENFPVLSSADFHAGQLVLTGTIDTPSPIRATIEFFANASPEPGADPSGYGQGAVYLGSTEPKANGTFTATLPTVAGETEISATATGKDGDTSEFARDIEPLPTSPVECKNNGWQSYGVFTNLGSCLAYMASGRLPRPHA